MMNPVLRKGVIHMDVDINYFAVLAAAVAAMAIGALWYSPALFGKMWMKLVGKTSDEIKKQGAATAYASSTIGYLVMAFVLAHFVDYAQATDVSAAIITGFWAWLGFVVTTQAIITAFEDRKWGLFLISVGNTFVSIVVMSIILTLWV